MTTITLESTKELGVKPRDAERSKNFFALGLLSWMYTRPIEPTLEWIEQKYAQPRAREVGQPRRVQGGLQLRRDGRALRPPVRGGAGATRTRALPQHHRQHRDVATGWSPAAQQAKLPLLVRVVPDHAGVRHPPRAVAAQELRRAHAPGRGRDRRDRRRDRRGVRGPARGHRDERPGRRPQVRGPRPRDQPRAAAAARRRAARRSVDRPADEDRAGRPPARHVRPPRRGPAADRRRAVRRATASTPRSRRSGSR